MTNRHFDTALQRGRDERTVSVCAACYDSLGDTPEVLHRGALSARGAFPCAMCGAMSDLMERHIIRCADLKEERNDEAE